MSKRREFLKTAGAVGTVGVLAGCLGGDGDGDDTEGEPGTDTDTEATEGGNETGTTADGQGAETTQSGTASFDSGLTFLMSPTEPQDEMEAQYQPVADHLSSELDTEVSLQYSRNYSAVISALDSGTGHIGEMGPFAAALGVRDNAVDIALQRYAYGGWDYSSVIITTEDSDIESLEDLEGKTVAFADSLSASGSLYPLYMIQEAGLDIGDMPEGSSGGDFEATFSSHAAAFEQLKAGQADAAGMGLFMAVVDGDEQRGEYKEGVREVAIEEGIPRAPICTTPQFDDAQRQAVVDAFLDAPDEMYYGADGEEGSDDDIWFSDVREADAQTYEPVVDVARQLNIESDLLDKDVE